jgi:hypothetical protein
VLTTVEVAELLQQEGTQLSELPEATLPPLAGVPQDSSSYGYSGGAGGYLEHVFRYIVHMMTSVPCQYNC